MSGTGRPFKARLSGSGSKESGEDTETTVYSVYDTVERRRSMKDETKQTINAIADTLDDTSGGLNTVCELVALAHSEVGEEAPDLDKIFTLLNATLDLIENHSETVQYLSDKLRDLIR